MMFQSKITPCLLFDGNGEEAAEYYVSIFKKSKITDRGQFTTSFRIEGHDFVALNGPKSDFTWAVSFYVTCRDQKEVDSYWDKLRANGGEEQPCGWVKDKFGLSWQIVPEGMSKLIGDKNKEKAQRAIAAMMTMKKIDLAAIKAAHAGKAGAEPKGKSPGKALKRKAVTKPKRQTKKK